MGHIGGATVDEFERICFEHEAQELLVRLGFKHNWLAIEAIIEEDVKWWEITKVMVAKNQAVVHIPDVADEEVMVCETLFEINGPICSLMDTTMRHSAGDKGLPM